MKRDDFIQEMNDNLKLVRTEYGLNQDKMAVCIGISKKTLVEIEKGRSSLGWSGAVTLAAIFSESTVLQNSYGGDMSDMLKALAFENTKIKYPKTMGGKIWWHECKSGKGWKIQQNYISQHYRLLTSDDRHVCSSFDYDTVLNAVSMLEDRK